MGRAAVGAGVAALLWVAPAVPLNTPTVSGGGALWTPSVSVTLTAAGGGADAVGYEFRTSTDSGGSWSPPSAGASVTVGAQGETFVQFRSVDALSNRSAWGGAPAPEGIVRIDRTTPTTPSQPAGASPAMVPALSWGAVTDSGGSGLAGYRILRNGVQVGTSPTTAYTDTTAPDGLHLYRVTAVDGAGNVSLQSPGRNVLADATPPGAPTITGAQPTPANVPDVVLTVSGATDATSGVTGFEYRTSTDGGVSWSSPLAGAVITVTAEGETLVQARAVDGAGNRGAWTPGHTGGTDPAGVVRIDRTDPPRPDAPSGGGWPLVISWPAVAGADTYTVRRNGAVIGTTSSTSLTDTAVADDASPDAPAAPLVTVPERGTIRAVWTPPADAGTGNAYTVRAADAAGNQSQISPAATLAAVSGVDHYLVQLDGREVGRVTEPRFALSGLSPVLTRSVTVIAVDAHGNASPASAEARVLPDPGPPPKLEVSAQRVMVKPGARVDLTARVTGISVGVVEWRLDGELLATGTRFSRVFTRPGANRLIASVLARDGSSVQQPVDVVVDVRPPDVTLVVRRNVLRVRAIDADTGIGGIRLLRGPRAPRSVGAAGVTLPDGRYAVVVRVEDLVGNRTDASEEILVDGTPPVLRVTAPGVAAPGTVVAAVSVRDGLSGVRRVAIDGRDIGTGGAVSLVAGRRHVITAWDRNGNRATMALSIAELAPVPKRHPALDGDDGDQLRYDPRGRPLTGVRLAVLRAAQSQLMAVQVLPPAWRVTDRYTVPLLRHVQRYQRRAKLPPNGTIGPATRAALDRDARRNRVTETR